MIILTDLKKDKMKYTEPMFKAEELSGKTILVTGGGTGLGRSMTKYFMQLGANVIIASRKARSVGRNR